MKLFKVNEKYYIIAKGYGEVEYILDKINFNEDINSIELIVNNVIVDRILFFSGEDHE